MLKIVEPAVPDAPLYGVEAVTAALREALGQSELDLPLPGQGLTAHRWSGLAGYGRRDMALARLVEGHVDAVAILNEAGIEPEKGALYGVWASRSAGKGAELHRDDAEAVLTGTVPFCSGVGVLDRALVVARPNGAAGAGDDIIFDVGLADDRLRSVPDTWHAAGMASSQTLDVELRQVPVDAQETVGPPGFYTSRPGFLMGGAGVSAVWFGGAVGVYECVLEYLAQRDADEHQLAHVAAMHVALVAADNTLASTAATLDGREPDLAVLTSLCRSVVEHAAGEVLARAPRITGPGLLTRDVVFSQRMADLEVYVRQHHGERDLAELGRKVVQRAANGVSR